MRALAAHANNEPDGVKRCTRYLWAVLQAHKLMASYIERGFRDHASIFPVINYHLFNTAVTKASLTKQSKACDTLVVCVKSLEQQANKRGGGKGQEGGPLARARGCQTVGRSHGLRRVDWFEKGQDGGHPCGLCKIWCVPRRNGERSRQSSYLHSGVGGMA